MIRRGIAHATWQMRKRISCDHLRPAPDFHKMKQLYFDALAARRKDQRWSAPWGNPTGGFCCERPWMGQEEAKADGGEKRLL